MRSFVLARINLALMSKSNLCSSATGIAQVILLLAGVGLSKAFCQNPVDLKKPTLTLSSPTAVKIQSTLSPMLVFGTAGDNIGVDRVEVVLNGGAPVAAVLGSSTKPSSVPFSASVSPAEGSTNNLVVTVFDSAGNSTSATRAFTFTRRHLLTLTRAVPTPQATNPDAAGTLGFATVPASSASILSKGPLPQTSMVLPGATVKLTATAKTGFMFDSWSGLPAGAVILANTVSFSMPAEDLSSVKATFVTNPLGVFGVKPVFQGLILPEGDTVTGIGTVGLINVAVVPAGGTFSGKLFMAGQTVPLTGFLLGDGSAWFKGKTLTDSLPLPFGGCSLEMSWTSMGLQARITQGAALCNSGLARPALHSSTNPVPAATGLLNRASKQGFFSLALPAQTQQPSMDTATYPQGTGFANLTLEKDGVLKIAGMLADGTTITGSSFLVAGQVSPFLIQLPTPGNSSAKGGCFLGSLIFDTAPADHDVTGPGLLWLRPSVIQNANPATYPYTDGWAGGITINATGALYDAGKTLQAALQLETLTPPSGNVLLKLEGDPLPAPDGLEIVNFNITSGKIIKVPASDKTSSLSFTPATGQFKGAFTPGWTNPGKTLPVFQGIVLQKGSSAGGFGFFVSNRLQDKDPQCGAVILRAPKAPSNFLMIMPGVADSPLTGMMVDATAGVKIAVLTNDELYHDSRFIRTLRQVVMTSHKGTLTFHFNEDGVPTSIITPSGKIINFDPDDPALEPMFDLPDSAPPPSFVGAPPPSVTSSSTEDLREQWRFFRTSDFYDKNELLNGSLGSVGPQLHEFMTESFKLINDHVERVIQIGSRNPALGFVNELIEFRNDVFDALEDVENKVKFSKQLLEGLENLNFDVPDWMTELGQLLDDQAEDLKTNVGEIVDKTNLNKGYWTATVWWPRPAEYDDEAWALTAQAINEGAAQLDRSIVDIVVKNSGFVVIWRRIYTDDFEAVKVQMQSLYGAPPWSLSGPFLLGP